MEFLFFAREYMNIISCLLSALVCEITIFVDGLMSTPYFYLIFSKIITNIGVVGTFGRASVPERLLNQSFYQEILLLQKFNDIGGKVLKPKKMQPPTSKK